MCVLKNGVGVVLANGEKMVVINEALVNQNAYINLNLYEDYTNKTNHNLDIIKVYSHLSEHWNDGYVYGLLNKMEDSELLFDYEKYVVKIIDCSSCYYIGDKEFFCPSLKEAEEVYDNVVKTAFKILNDKEWINSKTPIFKSDQLNFKATMFGGNENDIEREDVVFPIKIIMKRY